MTRTACTEPQCLYSRAIPLPPLWAVHPVQSLSACTRVTFTLPYYLVTSYLSLMTDGQADKEKGRYIRTYKYVPLMIKLSVQR
jgi:hypothetical protein